MVSGRESGTQYREGALTLCVVGASLWIAWITTIYSTDASFPASVDARLTTSDAFLVSTLALGLSLIVLSFFPAWTRRHLLGTLPLAIASCVGAAATLVVLNGANVPTAAFAVSAAATGMATSLIALRAALKFSEVETRSMLIAMGATLMLGTLIYAFEMMLLLCGLHSVAVVLLLLMLPLSAGLLTFDGETPMVDLLEGEGRNRIPARLWRLIVFIAMLLFLLSLSRGYYPNLMEPGQFTVSRCMVGLGLVLIGAAVAIVAWVAPRNAAFGTLFYGLLIVSVLVVLVLSLLNASPTVTGDVSSALFGMAMVCLWGLLCRVSFRSGMDAVQVVGVGFGAACLGTTAGVGAGAFIYAQGLVTSALTFIAAGAIVLCAAAALFLLRLADVKALMQPEPSEFDEPNDEGQGAAAHVPDSADSVAAGSGASALDGYEASLRRLCAMVSLDYGLSARESDVLELLVVGKDAKAIADELYISFNTVRSHIRRIYVKLDVHSRQELLALVKEGPKS